MMADEPDTVNNLRLNPCHSLCLPRLRNPAMSESSINPVLSVKMIVSTPEVVFYHISLPA